MIFIIFYFMPKHVCYIESCQLQSKFENLLTTKLQHQPCFQTNMLVITRWETTLFWSSLDQNSYLELCLSIMRLSLVVSSFIHNNITIFTQCAPAILVHFSISNVVRIYHQWVIHAKCQLSRINSTTSLSSHLSSHFVPS